jgi:hypothetical protein
MFRDGGTLSGATMICPQMAKKGLPIGGQLVNPSDRHGENCPAATAAVVVDLIVFRLRVGSPPRTVPDERFGHSRS